MGHPPLPTPRPPLSPRPQPQPCPAPAITAVVRTHLPDCPRSPPPPLVPPPVQVLPARPHCPPFRASLLPRTASPCISQTLSHEVTFFPAPRPSCAPATSSSGPYRVAKQSHGTRVSQTFYSSFSMGVPPPGTSLLLTSTPDFPQSRILIPAQWHAPRETRAPDQDDSLPLPCSWHALPASVRAELPTHQAPPLHHLCNPKVRQVPRGARAQ